MNVLLLNASYEPLDTISVERAMILLITEKVELIHAKIGKFIRTITQEFPFPEVVRLKLFVRFNRKELQPTKRNIFDRDLHTCQYCGSTKNLTIDHVLPVSKGGKNTWSNMVTCCFKCNNKKGNQLLDECGMTLKKTPGKPTYIHVIRKYSRENEINSWGDYIFN